MKTFKITLDTINSIILDKHGINLHELKSPRATQEQAMLKRCFCNLAKRYTDHTPTVIGKYLNTHRSSIYTYINTIDVLTLNPYYHQVYVELISTLNKLKKEAGEILDKVDKALIRIDELDKEIRILRKQIGEIKYG